MRSVEVVDEVDKGCRARGLRVRVRVRKDNVGKAEKIIRARMRTRPAGLTPESRARSGLYISTMYCMSTRSLREDRIKSRRRVRGTINIASMHHTYVIALTAPSPTILLSSLFRSP